MIFGNVSSIYYVSIGYDSSIYFMCRYINTHICLRIILFLFPI